MFSEINLKISYIIIDLKPTPTAKLERTNDTVYEATTCVVRAVMVLSQSVQSKAASSSSDGHIQSSGAGGECGNSSRRGSQSSNPNHLENVKNVGVELRSLLSAVDCLIPAFPSSTHREVIYKGKTLRSFSSQLISCVQFYIDYQMTSFVNVYSTFQVELAHKVLSKDMSDLVHSMKLVQKYRSTTVEAEYKK